MKYCVVLISLLAVSLRAEIILDSAVIPHFVDGSTPEEIKQSVEDYKVAKGWGGDALTNSQFRASGVIQELSDGQCKYSDVYVNVRTRIMIPAMGPKVQPTLKSAFQPDFDALLEHEKLHSANHLHTAELMKQAIENEIAPCKQLDIRASALIEQFKEAALVKDAEIDRLYKLKAGSGSEVGTD